MISFLKNTVIDFNDLANDDVAETRKDAPSLPWFDELPTEMR